MGYASSMTLNALSFDLWDTLIVDDSDEAERARRGLLPKKTARAELVAAAIDAAWPELDRAIVIERWTQVSAEFRHQWKQEHRTPGVPWRLDRLLSMLDRPRPPGFDSLVAALEEMELDPMPEPVPGIAAALDELAGRYRLGIASDAIVSPGRTLRELLRAHGLLQYFSAFAFSDEIGASKPASPMFRHLATSFDLPLAAMAHIGDREENDVAGPLALGMKAVLFTAVVDRGSDRSQATAICSSAASLPSLIATL